MGSDIFKSSSDIFKSGSDMFISGSDALFSERMTSKGGSIVLAEGEVFETSSDLPEADQVS